ncbi:hypothetical protein E2C01_077559 [Portunus trituberculatus]|uniref:Uncharacterized protein n=1 Tax=Portunus trituberculatus TaxID=210409 RepID=A0A5B7IGC4_PORTR|nr:hypothetical protein [Portunus trituberculatus]
MCACPWVKRPMSPIVRLSLSLTAANTVFSVSLSIGKSTTNTPGHFSDMHEFFFFFQ